MRMINLLEIIIKNFNFANFIQIILTNYENYGN